MFKFGKQKNLENKMGDYKYAQELNFWSLEIEKYQKWYKGEIPEAWGEPNPTEEQKVKVHNIKDSALLTFLNMHQKRKYLEDLLLESDAFSGMKLLDIGSGPFPSALAFENSIVYCLEPLIPDYVKTGFPLHYFDEARFMHAYSEDIPADDGFFDAVISVNAIDHVDNFFKTAQEVKRVLKQDGKMRMHIHYHPKTITEPIELNDDVVKKAYGWCNGFKKIHESKTKRGYTLVNEDETYTVWSNF